MQLADFHRLDRNVDDAIITADKAGYIRSYIVVPFAVFGTAEGIMHEAGIANPSSMPIPRLINVSLGYKAVPQLGEGGGRNQKRWIHVEDGESAKLMSGIFYIAVHHG